MTGKLPDPEAQRPPPTPRHRVLAKHSSNLPNSLYVLSFAPPLPSLFRQPREFVLHPYALYAIGTFSACIAGVGLPAFDIIFGYWTNGVNSGLPSIINARGSEAGIIATCVGVVFVATFAIFLITFSLAGVKLSNLVREQYLSSILSQDQAFFDRVGAGEIITRASRDIDSIRTGLGERLGYLIWATACIISAFVSAFVHSPRLAGVLFALIPVTFGLFSVLGYYSDKVSRQTSEVDGRASSFIEQILSSVRVVQSFDMSTKLIARLEYGFLEPLRKLSRRRSWVRAVEQGSTFGAGFLVYSMCFWFGGIEVARGQTVGDVLVTFYNYVNLFFSLATIMPHFLATSQAIQNLGNLRLQIERSPAIDIRETRGITLPSNGYIPSFELDNVTFAYPSRPGSKVLDRVSIKIHPGEFTAFVGPSGSGKSTLGALLLRLYDPDTGSKNTDTDKAILKTLDSDKNKKEKSNQAKERKELDHVVDGTGIVRFAEHDIQNLNLKWLRSQVSVVLQNPQLFSGTIFENVALGLTGTELEYQLGVDNVDQHSLPSAKLRLEQITERVEEALHLAEAWDFVQELPEGLQTRITGGRTGVLSGGQVQRIAIARALVRRPRCLFLDEATSAVSADTELAIQENLYREQKKRGMTMVVIAHRLSTITNADKIVVMVDGRVRISGTYTELMDEECKDQTFRSMALATTVKRDHSSSSSDDGDSATEVGTGEDKPETSTSTGTDIDKPIPAAMRRVSEAFMHVKSLLLFGGFLGLGAGGAFVVAAWLHGRAVASLSNPDIPTLRAESDRWALWFLVLAIGAVIATTFHAFGLEYGGEQIVASLKRESVRTLVKQEIAFFESTSSGLGSLTASATSHPAKVGAVIGIILGQAIISVANLSGTSIMAFVLNWRMGVMIVPGLVVAALAGYTNHVFLEKFENDINGDTEKQADFVGETANAMTTIAALTREQETLRLFRAGFTSKSMDVGKRDLVWASISMGMTQGTIHLLGGLLFYWGALQVAEGRVSIADVFTVFEAVIICIYVSAKILTYSGDFTRMRSSLKTIQGWIDRKPQYATASRESRGVHEKFEGIEFRDVELRYPARPDTLSLNSLSMRMEAGKSYAFCGTSGAGKSSILAVMQRFYDITCGSIMLDGVDIRDMPVEALRAEMGYVSQEPVLFEGTIRWNLLMGTIDPSAVSEADLEWALDQACMLEFVRSLPNGIDTDLGMKGGRLSGGQRQYLPFDQIMDLRQHGTARTDMQRLCIARALLRKPRILLLDEATSALDGQNEAKVQQAIENASAGRITIIIAHRLSTIRKADVIHVMEQGRLVESGSHEELLELNGRYFELVQAQL